MRWLLYFLCLVLPVGADEIGSATIEFRTVPPGLEVYQAKPDTPEPAFLGWTGKPIQFGQQNARARICFGYAGIREPGWTHVDLRHFGQVGHWPEEGLHPVQLPWPARLRWELARGGRLAAGGLALALLAALVWKTVTMIRRQRRALVAAGERQETHVQLAESSKMRAVGQLAAGVAHELNSPLCAVSVSLESALLAEDPEKARGRLERAQRAVERAKEIVEKLQHYTRPPAPERVDVAKLAQDTLVLLGAALTGAQANVETAFGEVPPVLASAQELQQVLIHLLTNAIQAIADQPPSRRRIQVGCGARNQDVFLQVRDSGCGIAEEAKGRIFEPFFSTFPGHAGLGLSASHTMVTQAGGHLDIDSEPGFGTVATIWLPQSPSGQ